MVRAHDSASELFQHARDHLEHIGIIIDDENGTHGRKPSWAKRRPGPPAGSDFHFCDSGPIVARCALARGRHASDHAARLWAPVRTGRCGDGAAAQLLRRVTHANRQARSIAGFADGAILFRKQLPKHQVSPPPTPMG